MKFCTKDLWLGAQSTDPKNDAHLIEPYSKDSYIVILASEVQLPVSRSGYARLRAFLDQKAQPFRK